MIRPEDERAIEDLFERLQNVERNSAPRDLEADRLIRQRLSENQAAGYYMAQTIIVQEAALREAQQRIEALEARQSQGGFLGGIFGSDRPEQTRNPQRGPWGQSAEDETYDRRRPSNGGGFLAGAAQTALGVTGGLLLGSALAGLFTGEAQAAETVVPPEPAPEDSGMDDGGGDWGGGDFDIGGDF
jgi:hypothetical protein